MRKLYVYSFLILSLSISLLSQQQDTLKNYNLDDIVITSGIILEPRNLVTIGSDELSKTDAVSLDEIGNLIPSVKVQTNSRGETLFYIRGASERQTTLFFDGIPLNIPWDNRIDLSLIPTTALSELTITKGIPSIIYGANNIAGIINVKTKEYSGKAEGNLSIAGGEDSDQDYSAYWLNGNNKVNYLVSGSYYKTMGYKLPESYSNPANPSEIRKNSDHRSYSLFGKVNYNISNNTKLHAAISYINSKKGVPPETDVANPRYWRYSDWQKLTADISGSTKFENGKRSILAFALSATKFDMQIDQYQDPAYSRIDDIEKDNDLTYYGRLNYTRLFGNNSILKYSLSGLISVHNEKFLADNYKELTYSQSIYSTGLEYEYFNDDFNFILGSSLDGTAYPKTGDKPSKDSFTDYSINTSFQYKLNCNIAAQINLGRKTRFPTPRETFSGALGRFVPNPGLKAEVGYSGEFRTSFHFTKTEINASIFYSLLKDGIVRVSLPGRQFQRVNKDEIRNIGFELILTNRVTDKLDLNFNFTYLNSHARNKNGEFTDTLEYKPKFVSNLFLNYDFTKNFSSTLETYFVADEYGLKEGTTGFQKLPSYFLANVRFSYEFNIYDKTKLEFFIRVNNIFDKLYYTQWSLPEAGRQFFAGLTFDF